MSPDARRVICHWHLQLADPLYRAFTGDYLVTRRRSSPWITRDLVVTWVVQQGNGRWTMPTHIQFASKLLSAAFSAGLLATNRDPRRVTIPRVPDEALEYMMYLLREVKFEGTLLQNPYLASLGLDGASLEERLSGLPGLAFRRQGDLIDFGWRHPDLRAWRAPRRTAIRLADVTMNMPLFQQSRLQEALRRCGCSSDGPRIGTIRNYLPSSALLPARLAPRQCSA